MNALVLPEDPGVVPIGERLDGRVLVIRTIRRSMDPFRVVQIGKLILFTTGNADDKRKNQEERFHRCV